MINKPDDAASPTPKSPRPGRLPRRAFIKVAGGVAGGAAVGFTGVLAGLDVLDRPKPVEAPTVEPFYGAHQAGITTTPQSHTYFAAFDLVTEKVSDVRSLLQAWTTAAATLTAGQSLQGDVGDAVDLGPARLTLNVGFGPGLFVQSGVDRYGLASRRPAALVDMPAFPADELDPARTGGDLSLHACADDPQVAFHAVRQLALLASGVATVRWGQAGFHEGLATGGTLRNLMGFKDGTINPRTTAELDQFVWVGAEGPDWMIGGAYLVIRRIRMALDHWDSKDLATQQLTVGRYKTSGAPLSGAGEFDALDFAAKGPSGDPLIPSNSHVFTAAPQTNGGQMILRRGYAYNDGVSPFVERWQPWQSALMYDAGLLFAAYQRDPRTGFIAINNNLALNDAMTQFITHTGSLLVALPPGAAGPGSWLGQALLQDA